MNTLYVIASSPEQRHLRLPAAQLYIGELFSASITHARRFSKREQDVRILSPKFGLVSQMRLLEPYKVELDDLKSSDDVALIEAIRSELPRRGVLPLRFIVLGSDEYVALLQSAIAGTRFETVPIRAPLSRFTLAQQIQWLQSATWPIECDVELPNTEHLSPSENVCLHDAVRGGATWWSRQLMNASPPPEATLLANALALQLCKTWEEVASTARGDWPEDIAFPIALQDASGPIAAALRAIGLFPGDWWKREGAARPPQISMRFSIAKIEIQENDRDTVIFP